MEAALECYYGAIRTMRQHAVEVSEDDLAGFRDSLLRLEESLKERPSIEGLEASGVQLDQSFSEYSAKVSRYHAETKREAEAILSLLREALGSVGESAARHDESCLRFAERIEASSNSTDLREMRLMIAEQVAGLRLEVHAMRTERARSLQPLEQELRSIEDRLKEAEHLASTDPLTHLFNRREGQRRAETRLRNNQRFCLLVVDVNRFKWINDRFGHHGGDQVLVEIGRRLVESVRSDDVVCRWGGDEFLVIMNCELPDALQRSRQIAKLLRGGYQIDVNGKKVQTQASASIGVSQCIPGDTVEKAFERADRMLYQIKKGS